MTTKMVLSRAGEKCVWMSRELSALTDYVTSVVDENLHPQGLAMCLFCVSKDIEDGRCHFTAGGNLPDYIRQNRSKVLKEISNFPQVIDELFDPQFAKDFRVACKEWMNINPPRRNKGSFGGYYPEYINVAIEWWGNIITAPQMATNSIHAISQEKIAMFKTSLGESIKKEVSRYGRCIISVNYRPCTLLANAGTTIGISAMDSYPWKTEMFITEHEVRVSLRAGAYETLWEG